jgi:hypothetical protein
MRNQIPQAGGGAEALGQRLIRTSPHTRSGRRVRALLEAPA